MTNDPGLTDLNVSYGAWPFQRFPHRSLAQLAGHLNDEGIDLAFVSPLGGVFCPDPDSFNVELFEEATGIESVVPVPVINPAFPGWRDRLEGYRSRHNITAVKIHPNYHRYGLLSDEMEALSVYLSQAGIPLFLQMRMEDERMRYAGLDVVGVLVDDVIALHAAHPDLPLYCLNAYLPEARRLGREAPGVYIDTAFAEWMFTMEHLLEDIRPDRIFFGSHSPFLYTRASADKLRLAPIEEAFKTQIGSTNAMRSFWR